MEVQTMNDEPLGISGGPKFWQSLSEAEVDQIFKDEGVLTGELATRMWRMCEMQGPCPPALVVMVNARDVERLIRKEKKQRRKLRASPGRWRRGPR
jgi:hypothetical protein